MPVAQPIDRARFRYRRRYLSPAQWPGSACQRQLNAVGHPKIEHILKQERDFLQAKGLGFHPVKLMKRILLFLICSFLNILAAAPIVSIIGTDKNALAYR